MARNGELTEREAQVLARAESGESNKIIALALGISPSSVATYLERARKKRMPSGPAASGEPRKLTVPALLPRACRPTPVAHLLTEAERAVLELALGGLSNAAIARARGASPRTVANQLEAVYRKLTVGSRRELRSKFSAPFQNTTPSSKVAT